jgi:hypothetical protein
LKKLRKRLTYANVMSSIAVFLVLGGATAIAAGGLGKNSVGSKQLKKNAVTAAKIKNNAITTAKIGSEAVTGDKIKESTLAAVPSATNAVNATNATNAVNATNAQNFSRYFNLGLKKASVGQTNVSLGNVGPFAFVGDCEDKGGGEVEASIFLLTSVENSEMESYGDQFDWDMKTTDRAELGYNETRSREPYGFFYPYYDGWSASDGSSFLEGEAHPMVKTLGADCAFLVTGFNETP